MKKKLSTFRRFADWSLFSSSREALHHNRIVHTTVLYLGIYNYNDKFGTVVFCGITIESWAVTVFFVWNYYQPQNKLNVYILTSKNGRFCTNVNANLTVDISFMNHTNKLIQTSTESLVVFSSLADWVKEAEAHEWEDVWWGGCWSVVWAGGGVVTSLCEPCVTHC